MQPSSIFGLILAVLVATASSATAQGVKGFNMPGGDYDNFEAHSPQVCQNTCAGEPHCKGWTWVKPGVQGPKARCWLKSSVPTELTPDANCTSGQIDGMLPQDVRAEDKTDRPGKDYKSFEVNAWERCESACRGERECTSWTYRRRGVNGPNGACWLKNGAARPVANSGFVSGVKLRRANF